MLVALDSWASFDAVPFNDSLYFYAFDFILDFPDRHAVVVHGFDSVHEF